LINNCEGNCSLGVAYTITEGANERTLKHNFSFFLATLDIVFKYGIAVVKDKPKSLNGYLLNPGELLRSASISGSIKNNRFAIWFWNIKRVNLHISKKLLSIGLK
jgi:hypothetical protein